MSQGLVHYRESDGTFQEVSNSKPLPVTSDGVDIAPYVDQTITLANVANASPAYIYINMDGFDSVSVHVEQTGGTDTFDVDYESSNEGYDSTVDWIDTTSSWTSVGGAVFTTDHIAQNPADFAPKGHRVEITTAGGSNDADFNVFIKKLKK